jgi:hypothetical protein
LICGDFDCTIGNDDFMNQLPVITRQVWGIEAGVRRQLEIRGLSQQCSSCYAALSSCHKSKCIWKCLSSANNCSCMTCGMENCNEAFSACSGLWPAPQWSEFGNKKCELEQDREVML